MSGFGSIRFNRKSHLLFLAYSVVVMSGRSIAHFQVCTPEVNYAYKVEVMNAVRELVDQTVIYPTEDPEGRDVELGSDIETLCIPKELSMETMVPRGGTKIVNFQILTTNMTQEYS